MASMGLVTAGRGSMSTHTIRAASAAWRSVSAITTATASPVKRTRFRAGTAWVKRRSAPGEPTPRSASPRSEWVNTATTPGDSAASSVSMSVMIPWGVSERTTFIHRASGWSMFPT